MKAWVGVKAWQISNALSIANSEKERVMNLMAKRGEMIYTHNGSKIG